MIGEVFVRLVPLPVSVHGFVLEDPAGDYNVYIREQDAPNVQTDTLQHELEHIQRGHLDGDLRPVAVMEMEANYGHL